MKREALYAFREACRLRGDDARLWGHAALAALDVGRFDEAIYDTTRTISLGGPPLPQVSSLVAQAVVQDVKDSDGERSRRLLDKAVALLELSCTSQPLEAAHWEARLHVVRRVGTADELPAILRLQLEAYRKHMRWLEQPDELDAVVEVCAQLVEALLESGEDAALREAKKLVEEMLHAASNKLAASQGCESLRMLQAKIRRHDDD